MSKSVLTKMQELDARQEKLARGEIVEDHPEIGKLQTSFFCSKCGTIFKSDLKETMSLNEGDDCPQCLVNYKAALAKESIEMEVPK